MLGCRVGIIASSRISELPTPWIWIDINDASTITLSGSQITQVVSKTGSTSGLTFKVPYTKSLTGAPTTGPNLNTASLNGLNTMLFTSSPKNGLQSTVGAQILPDPGSISGFIVFKETGSANGMTSIEHVQIGYNTHGFLSCQSSGSGVNSKLAIQTNNVGLVETNAIIGNNYWIYWYWEVNVASGVYTNKFYVNGVFKLSTTGALGVPTASDFLISIGGPMILSGSYNQTYGFIGEIAEILEYKYALTDTQRVLVQNYIKAKYNL